MASIYTLEDRMALLAELGDKISKLDKETKKGLYYQVFIRNKWFTTPNVDLAIEGVLKYLNLETLRSWVRKEGFTEGISDITVGIIMAGNIPLAGFHDFLTVFLSGCKVAIKLSSKDDILFPYIFNILCDIEPECKGRVLFVDRMNATQAIIATGSNNTSRYFDYYFAKRPHIIRKNRNSLAILLGNESKEEFLALSKDVFSYFGLGCRNVSKLMVPKEYDFSPLIESWKSVLEEELLDHNKYANNYFYNRSVFLMNADPHLDAGFILFQENKGLNPPGAVLYWESYENITMLEGYLKTRAEEIQCVVSKDPTIFNALPLGSAQYPEIDTYADGVNTAAFMKSLRMSERS